MKYSTEEKKDGKAPVDDERGQADSKDLRVSVSFASTNNANHAEAAATGFQVIGGDSTVDNTVSGGVTDEKNTRSDRVSPLLNVSIL